MMNFYRDNSGHSPATSTPPAFKKHKLTPAVALLAATCAIGMLAPCAQAQLDIALTTIGKAGNAADTTGYGAVNYNYQIGTTSVTNAQYAAFLNSVAKSDPHKLYNTSMKNYTWGGIERSGASGSYVYTVTAGRENVPVMYVSYIDAARFTNWLTNGANSSASTESGMYTFTEGNIYASLNRVSDRNEAAWAAGGYAIASEDEWYKAAYYNLASESYTPYATGDTIDTTQASYANSYYYLVADGAYAPEQNGTYGMMGNVQEWTEGSFLEDIPGLGEAVYHIIRGGAYNSNAYGLESDNRSQYSYAAYEYSNLGFRITTLSVPEPSTYAGIIGVLALGFVILRRRKHARAIA